MHRGCRALPDRGLHSPLDFADETLALYRDGRKRGLLTGWASLDELMTIRPGELTVVTGIPNSGKSEFVDALMVNLASRYGWRFAVCSFENPPEEHIAKLAEKHLGKPFWDGPTWRMSEAELHRANDGVAGHFVFIRADDEAPTIEWILERARVAVMRHGSRGLVIDPYNEIEHIQMLRQSPRRDDFLIAVDGNCKAMGHRSVASSAVTTMRSALRRHGWSS